jgi:hypothetical protein
MDHSGTTVTSGLATAAIAVVSPRDLLVIIAGEVS